MALQKKIVQTGDYAWKSWSNGYVICLTLTEENTNIAANTSEVSYQFTISNTDNNRFVDGGHSWTISIADQAIEIGNFTFDLRENYTTQTIAEGRLTVPHHSDGRLEMPYAVSIPDIRSGNRYGPPGMTLSGVWELTAIPRVSTVSCPLGIIGKQVTVMIQKADESYRHTVTYNFGGIRGTVAELTQSREISWTIPMECYTKIPNAKRGVGSLYCKTYQGETLLGETSCQFYADIDEATCRPVITPRVEDINETTCRLTGDSSTLIRYHSDVSVTVDYAAQNAAALTACSMHHNGKTYGQTALVIPCAESGSFAFSATDSRGLTTAVELERPLIPYVKLSCNLANSKPDGEGDMPIFLSGNYFAGSFGAEDNSLIVQYRYKRSGTTWQDTEEQWHTVQPVITGNTYTADTVLTGLDYQQAYTIQARAVDKLATVKTVEYTVRAIPVFDWGEEDFAIHGDLSVDGTVSLQNRGVLNTPYVQTHYWRVKGGVTLQNAVDFVRTRTTDCAFITMIQGDAYPFVGVLVGSVCINGNYGAGVLYDYAGGAQPFRLLGGELQ